jgi:hypothetical protein
MTYRSNGLSCLVALALVARGASGHCPSASRSSEPVTEREGERWADATIDLRSVNHAHDTGVMGCSK